MTNSNKNLLNQTVFFIGWLLSPATFWNDAFVNIPLSYFSASLFVRAFPINFLLAVLIFYWLSNILGIFMMYAAGRNIILEDKSAVRELLKLILAIALYSLVVIALGWMGLLRPF